MTGSVAGSPPTVWSVWPGKSASAATAPVIRCDVHVEGELLRFWVGENLVKTAARTKSDKESACNQRSDQLDLLLGV
jgi:hypothetical protein